MPINFRDKTIPATILYVLGAFGVIVAFRPKLLVLAFVVMACAAGYWIGRQ